VKDILIVLAIFAAYIVLMRYILPRFGVKT